MKKFIKKISEVVQVILMAPVKLPGKVMSILKYIGLELGVIEIVLEPEDKIGQPEDKAVQKSETAYSSMENSKALLSPTRTTNDKEVQDEI